MNKKQRNSKGVNARKAALEILDGVSSSKADDLLDEQVSSFQDARDRNLIQYLAYGTLRHRSWLDWCLTQVNKRSRIKVPERVQNIMRLGAFQILFSDRIPNYAAVSGSVQLCKDSGFRKQAGLVNALLRNLIRLEDPVEPPSKDEDFGRYISVKYSLPRWIVDRLLRVWPGPIVESFAQASLVEPQLTIRLSPTKITSDEFICKCHEAGIEVIPHGWLKDAFEVITKTPVYQIPGYDDGWFSVQDAGTQLVHGLISPQPGESILEIGSAPGGKTIPVAESIGEDGVLYAVDNMPDRVQRLQQNLERMSISNVRTIICDATGSIPGINEKVDTAIVDAPCSGLGTLRRRIDLKWRLQPNDPDILARLQKELMKNAARYVKDGGVLIYSTCTILEEENQEVVESFLEEHPEWSMKHAGEYLPPEAEETVLLNGSFQTRPDRDNMDGIYAARLVKEKK